MQKKSLFSVALIASAAALLLGTVQPSYAADVTAQSGSVANSGAQAVTGPTIINTAAPQPTHTTTTVDGTQTIKNVPSAYAPALTTTLTETCMGSTSGGVSVAGFGVSAGSTWSDAECINRLNARELRAMGENAAAKEVLCENPAVRAAFQKVGKPCIGEPSSAPAKTAAVSPQGPTVTPVQPASVETRPLSAMQEKALSWSAAQSHPEDNTTRVAQSDMK